MGRTACIDLPAFPLQLLLRRHPEWSDHPAAVVDSDRPQGKILWVNERGRSFRILPGMRYAAGLSLAGTLRAGEVPAPEIERAVADLAGRLRNHSPGIEPAAEDPGVFWIDATGLERLYDSPSSWAGEIREELRRLGFESSMAVGFGRFASYALARAARGLTVLQDPAAEQEAVRRVPLDRLRLDPDVRDTLDRLGVRTLGQFLDLPPEGVARRFGSDLHRLHRLAAGAVGLPVQPERPSPPARKRLVLDHAETDRERLLVGVEGLLEAVLEVLEERGHRLTGMQLRLSFDLRPRDHRERIRPAEPTLDRKQLLQLIRLRLESLKLQDGVVEVELQADSTPAASGQRGLFDRKPRRDLAAADRALARIRAELGEGSVVRARLRDGHLPEARYRWEEMDHVSEPRPGEVDEARMVRRVYGAPVPLPPRERHEPDGWMLQGLEQGPVVRVLGPYVISGGWWNRPVSREYHFAETQRGQLLWVYYDRERRRWFLQGRVE